VDFSELFGEGNNLEFTESTESNPIQDYGVFNPATGGGGVVVNATPPWNNLIYASVGLFVISLIFRRKRKV